MREWKICMYIASIATVLMLVGWILWNTPREWFTILSFVTIFTLCCAIPAAVIIELRHRHNRITEHHIGQHGLVLGHHGKFHEFKPAYQQPIQRDSGMHVYHHPAQIAKTAPGYGADETTVEELPPEITTGKLLAELSDEQQKQLLDHATSILAPATTSQPAMPKNITSIDPIKQRARELRKEGKGRVIIARELGLTDTEARNFIEEFEREEIV